MTGKGASTDPNLIKKTFVRYSESEMECTFCIWFYCKRLGTLNYFNKNVILGGLGIASVLKWVEILLIL